MAGLGVISHCASKPGRPANRPHAEVAASLSYDWFTTNPIHVLKLARAARLRGAPPPLTFYERGKEYLQHGDVRVWEPAERQARKRERGLAAALSARLSSTRGASVRNFKGAQYQLVTAS